MMDLQYDLAHEGTWTIPGTSGTVTHEVCDHDNHTCYPFGLRRWEVSPCLTEEHCPGECDICDMEAGE